MPEIQPIDDSYIDGVIKAADAYNPNLSKTQGVRLRELIKLMRDRFEQRLATVPYGSAAAESVQSYAAMLANGVPNSMTTYEVATDEKRNITNSIYQWWPDGKLFFIDTILGSEGIPTQTLPGSTRALPFTCDPTTIEAFTTSSDVVFSLDETNAVNGASVVLAILQNDPVDFPANFIELAGSKQAVLGKMNYYIVTRLSGTYQFIRYQNPEDTVENAIVVGATQLTIDSVAATTAALSWSAATNATQYVVKRYTAADYSDAPITVYTGPNLSVTDTGMTAGTHYYYKINSGATTMTGRAAYADTVATASAGIATLFSTIFATDGTGLFDDNSDGHVEIEGGSARFSNYQCAHTKNSIPNYSQGDHIRITLGNYNEAGDQTAILNVTFGGQVYPVTGTGNPDVVIDIPASGTPGPFTLAGTDSGIYLFIGSVKIDNLTPASTEKLTGTAFSYNGIDSPEYTAANAFDGVTANNLSNCFASVENPAEVYIGLNFGSAKMVKAVKVYPRDSENGNTILTDRLLNTKVQGSNTSSSAGFVDLYTITSVTQGQFNTYLLADDSSAYQYYRLYKSDGTNLDVAEIEFYANSGLTNELDPTPVLQAVKLNLTASPNHTALSDWNNYDYGMVPGFLNNVEGAITGIKFIVDNGTAITEDLGFEPSATTNFPGSVSSTLWYQEAGGLTTWRFTGLEDSKTYTIKTYSFDTSDNGETAITWGGITQNSLSFNNQLELTFSNISPVAEEIIGSFSGPGIYTVINGIILSED